MRLTLLLALLFALRVYAQSSEIESDPLIIPNFRIEPKDSLDDLDCNETGYFTHLQNFHQLTEDIIVENANRIDMYFSGSRAMMDSKQSTYVDISLKGVEESLRPFEYDLKINTFFSLPNTEEKYKLVLQSYNEDDSIDSGLANGDSDTLQKDNTLLLGLQYDMLEKYLSNVYLELGAKFLGVLPDPYVRVKMRQSYLHNKYVELWISNDFSYFAIDQVDNRSEFRITHIVQKNQKLEWYNSYRYQQKDVNNPISTHEVSNALSISQLFSHQRGVTLRGSIYSRREDDGALKLNYYMLGMDFRQVIYDNWLYLEFNPAFMWRSENHYAMTPRGSVTMGIIFGETQKYNTKGYRYGN